MSRSPWMKFYPADWRSDTALRACSPAARAVWLDMIGLMHEAEPYGHLVLNGSPPSIKTLSGLFNVHHRTLIAALKELEDNGVYSRDEAGVIFSRRMVRDYEKALKDKENGKKGGNPGVKRRPGQGVNPALNGGDKAQKPEARSQKPDKVRVGETRAGARGPAAIVLAAVPHPLLDPHKSLQLVTGAGRVAAWVEAGADLDRDIVPTVRAMMAARRPADGPVGSWSWFERAVRRTAADRIAAEQPQRKIQPEEHDHGLDSTRAAGRNPRPARNSFTEHMLRRCAEDQPDDLGRLDSEPIA